MSDSTLKEIIDGAIEELEEAYREGKDDPYFEDRISEITDSSVPIYNGDLLQLGSNNWELMLTEPELGPAFDGTATPINIIAANIYETIYQALHKRYRELQDEDGD